MHDQKRFVNDRKMAPWVLKIPFALVYTFLIQILCIIFLYSFCLSTFLSYQIALNGERLKEATQPLHFSFKN